ncbi:thioredoxin 2 [Plasmodium sp. DRC-Itaito]|nr:thioredoxin 2 [Plasmodium sp. DRC-Itaito]
MKKYIFFFLFSFINFFCFYDVLCTKEVTSTNDDPLTPLNRFDKYYLRMFKKVPRLQQNGSNIINGVNMKNTVIVLYFFAKWCQACTMQSTEMDKLQKYYGKRIYLLKVDLDKNESLARKFSVKSLPTIILLKNKTMLARKDHFVSSNDLIALIKKHL